MAWAMVWPCAGPNISVRSTSMSSVPDTMSPGVSEVFRRAMPRSLLQKKF